MCLLQTKLQNRQLCGISFPPSEIEKPSIHIPLYNISTCAYMLISPPCQKCSTQTHTHAHTHAHAKTLNSVATRRRRGWRADRACSTFPSDRAEGIKTVSNSESAWKEGVGRQGLCGLCLHWALRTRTGSQLISPCHHNSPQRARQHDSFDSQGIMAWLLLGTVCFRVRLMDLSSCYMSRSLLSVCTENSEHQTSFFFWLQDLMDTCVLLFIFGDDVM